MEVTSGGSTHKSIEFQTDTYSVNVTANKCKREVQIKDKSKYFLNRIYKKSNKKIIRYIINLLDIALGGILEILLLSKIPEIMFVLYSITLIKGIISFFTAGLNINYSKRLKKNHAAEHIVFNGYKELGRIPNEYELERYSKYSVFCSTNVMILKIVVCLIRLITKVNFPVYLVCNILFIIRASAIFTPLQFLSTSKPAKENIDLALFAIKRLEKVEKEGSFEEVEEYIVNSSNKVILKKITNVNAYTVMDDASIEEVDETLREYINNFNENINISVKSNYIELNKNNYTEFQNLLKQEA